MKFRRNVQEEKLFKIYAAIFAVVLVIFIIMFIVTKESNLIRLILPVFLAVVLFIANAASLSKSYIEFKKDKIIIINGNNRNFEINMDEIEVIKLPSEKALKNKMKMNAVIFKRKDAVNISTYSLEIEEYIKKNLNVKIVYYDNYTTALK